MFRQQWVILSVRDSGGALQHPWGQEISGPDLCVVGWPPLPTHGFVRLECLVQDSTREALYVSLLQVAQPRQLLGLWLPPRDWSAGAGGADGARGPGVTGAATALGCDTHLVPVAALRPCR